MKSISTLLFICHCWGLVVAQIDTTRLDRMPLFGNCLDSLRSTSEHQKCSEQAIARFIATHLQYPDEVRSKQLEGVVLVSFLVDEKGNISQEKVLRDIGGGSGEAALAVVRAMPAWHPAQRNGENVKTKLNLPIRFSLKNEKETESQKFTIQWGTLRGSEISRPQIAQVLHEPITIRDAYGYPLPIAELIFIEEKKRKSYSAKISGGVPSKKMKKLARKVSAGSTFILSGLVQQQGKFVVVERSFLVK